MSPQRQPSPGIAANPGTITAPKLPRVRRTQAERVAESDHRLMEAAIRLVARVGYTHTTLESIGVEAGYSRGLVQHRFGSKDRLQEST